MTKQQLKQFIEQVEQIFDEVRLVDVASGRTYDLDAKMGLHVQPHQCFAFWRREERCENCSSAKAFITKGQVNKYEFVDNRIFFVISKYIEVDGEELVLEMINGSNDKSLYDAYGDNNLATVLNKLNLRVYKDSLTGAYNRRYYEEQIKGIIRENDGLMLLDVDQFKMINDTYGHLAGDLVLKELVKIMFSMTREYDAVVRYGGDEFLVLFRNIGESAFQKRLYQMQNAIRGKKLEAYPEIDLTVSIGGICCKTPPQTDILEEIDKLLYLAKQKKDAICVETLEEE